MSLAVKRYAEALSDVAAEKNCLDEVRNEFGLLYRNLKSDRDFERLITGDYLSVQEKKNLLDSVFRDGNPWFRGFLTMLAERDHLDEAADMYLAFEESYKNRLNILDVEAVTAVPLTDELRQRLIGGLTKKYGKKIELTETVDPSILGGMVLYVGSEMLDASLKTRYNGLKEHLKKTEL